VFKLDSAHDIVVYRILNALCNFIRTGNNQRRFMPKMMQNAVIFNKKIIISCIAMIASMLLFAFSACTGGRGTGQESTTAPALLTPSVEPTAEMTIKPSAAATNDPEEDIVAEMMTEMTLEEKVGQLFIVRPESLDESFTPNQAHGSQVQ